MAHYILVAIVAILMLAVLILQNFSFVFIYALIWMFSGPIYIVLTTALFFGSVMFLLVSFPSFVRKIRAQEIMKIIKVPKYFLGNTIPKE